ncbi:MAG: hypoxanthine phosphoribosyltransferase [Thermoleophilia bacterium]|jgi:hypoxanthine phosphoribosyltransferase|nr:hypoxanthine phosphoribosyltransferase [Actinomycetota bacterium]
MSAQVPGEIILTRDQIQGRVAEMAAEVSVDYAGRDPLIIGILKGAVFFTADLVREMSIPCEFDFMAVSSYGSATHSSGVVRITKDLDTAIEGRHVLVVEDVIDSGRTLRYLMRNLASREPASLEVCALLAKPAADRLDLRTRYVGFRLPDVFVVGYGLDVDERHRELPYIATLGDATGA